ncbi:MAG: ribonuclease HI [Pseudomonadota bacterium]|nr:ribonuclease HI [Pseudomonadota bacterium]QKK04431.1 MAG: ribonuclease HI [Pseudomonadota bacterium]
MKKVDIFTDGACSGNPGPGGWGTILRYNGHEKELSGGTKDTTNNRMEMTAVIEGLKALTSPCDVTIHSDSQYVIDGATKWLQGWKKRDWKTAGRKPLKNSGLWKTMDEEMARHHSVKWIWVKGHSGHPENERADQLARDAIPYPFPGEEE